MKGANVLTRTHRPRFSGRGNRVRFHPPTRWHQNPLEGIRESFQSTIAIEKALGQNVQRALEMGNTWSDVGRALGVAKDAKSADDVIEGLAAARKDLWSGMFCA